MAALQMESESLCGECPYYKAKNESPTLKTHPPMNLTIKQLVVILTTLLLLAVGVVYEAFSMFPSMF
jgi:hypothetical protein